jgi:hypothetical protein
VASHRNLEEARTPHQVLTLTRDYLAALSARDLARVPERCRPERILDETDISGCSRRLTEEYWQLRGTAADVGVLQEMWSFFLRASIQLARLQEQEAESE